MSTAVIDSPAGAEVEESAQGNPSHDPAFVVPCRMEYVFVTPDLACRWLGAANFRNRDVSDPQVIRLVHACERGEWMYDSTDAVGLVTDESGDVVSVANGQHRLTMVVKSGLPGTWMPVIYGVRPDVIKVIDQGNPRSLAQQLKIEGQVMEPQTVAAAVGYLYAAVHGFEKSTPLDSRMTLQQGLVLLDQHPGLVLSVASAGEAFARVKIVPKSVLTAYHYMFSSADSGRAATFFSTLASGLDAEVTDPAYMLRERLAVTEPQRTPGGRTPRMSHVWEKIYLMVTAWEVYRSGRVLTSKQARLLQTARPASTDPFPRVTGVDWIGPVEMDGEQL